jgi:hypothetical protein
VVLSQLIYKDLKMQVFENREEFLTQGVEEFRPVFDAIKRPLPLGIKIACGFAYGAKRSKAIGQCFSANSTKEGVIQIFICPTLSDPIKVLETVVHELCHATAGAMNHGKVFQSVARLMLLEPLFSGKNAWRGTKGKASFTTEYANIIEALGDYPNPAIELNVQTKTQTTRMLKAVCPSCDYTVRLSAKWAYDADGNPNLPTCPCGDTLAL